MNTAVVEVSREVAEAQLEKYRAQNRKQYDERDALIVKGYEAIKKGQQVIRLVESFRQVGLNAQGFPALAIARADSDNCWLSHWWNTTDAVLFTDVRDYEPRGMGLITEHGVRMPAGTIPLEPRTALRGWNDRARSITPTIPPEYRPAFPHAYHVLWEAEWIIDRPRASRDPALIKYIGGDLWAVLATWDLTELERAVMLR
jgi:hypothetical protein